MAFRIKSISKPFFLFGSGLIIVLAAVAVLNARTFTPPFTGLEGKILPGSIAEERRIELGGWPQYVLIRGRNRNAPVLLFLHGGPGTTEMPMTRLFNAQLENDFVFVNWDQRGTGKSYSAKLDPETLTLERLTSDLDELVDLLRAEFNTNNVLLVCHSWGTHLGLNYVSLYPEKVAAYVGIGQISNPVESDRRGTEWVMEKARRAGDQKAVRDLATLGADPFSIDETILQRKYIWKYGGAFHEPKSIFETVRIALKAKEISWLDFFAFRNGTNFSLEALWTEIMEIDAKHDYPVLKVPVYFMLGRHDYQVSSALAREYFDVLEAPAKQLLWFEKSAHSPPFEEPELFNAEIRKIASDVGLIPLDN
jgi:pimeloyl-ACP methyl ester carboxylesterase